MQTKLLVLLSLTMLFALSGGQCEQGNFPTPTPPPQTGCAGTFFPTRNVQARWDQVYRRVVISWERRGATPGTFRTYRCYLGCNYWENYQPIGEWGSGTVYDQGQGLPQGFLPGVTYHYAIRNRYPPCGEHWSENTFGVIAP